MLPQVAREMISIDNTILLNLSAEAIVYISNKLMVNLGNTFRNCRKRELNREKGISNI